MVILMPIYYLEINIICIIILLAIFDKFKDESLNNSSDKYYEKTLLATISFSLFALISGIFNGTSYNFSQIILIISHSLKLRPQKKEKEERTKTPFGGL